MPMPCPWLCDDSTERAFAVRRDTPPESLTSASLLPTWTSIHSIITFSGVRGRLTYSHHVRKAVVILLVMSATVQSDATPTPILHYLSIGLECRRLGTQIFHYSQIH